MFWWFFFRENRCGVTFCFSLTVVKWEHSYWTLHHISCLVFLNAKTLWGLLFPNALPDWKGEDAVKTNRGQSVHWNWKLKQQLLGHLSLLQLMADPAELQWHSSPAKPSLPGLVHFVLKTGGVLIRLQNNWGVFFSNSKFLLTAFL